MARPRTRPLCATCGRALRKPRDGAALPVEIVDGVSTFLTADGLPPARGDYGDNLVCTPRCGWILALRIVRAVPGVLELLPQRWRPTREATLITLTFSPARDANPNPEAKP